MEELKRIEIRDKSFIQFVNRTDNLGRAEFVICPKYSRGKIVELNIYHKQQENISTYYHWQSKKGTAELNFSSYEGLSYPNIWRTFYCKEHKTQSLELYVPIGANFIWFQVYSFGITIGFTVSKFGDIVNEEI